MFVWFGLCVWLLAHVETIFSMHSPFASASMERCVCVLCCAVLCTVARPPRVCHLVVRTPHAPMRTTHHGNIGTKPQNIGVIDRHTILHYSQCYYMGIWANINCVCTLFARRVRRTRANIHLKLIKSTRSRVCVCLCTLLASIRAQNNSIVSVGFVFCVSVCLSVCLKNCR